MVTGDWYSQEEINRIYKLLLKKSAQHSDFLLHEKLIAERHGSLLFRCIRFFKRDVHNHLVYHEAWKSMGCYQKQEKSINGGICYIGFFFQKEEDVVKRFMDLNFESNLSR